MTLDPEDPLAVAVAEAIRGGDLDGLRRLLAEHPGLASARIGGPEGTTRSLLHVATDWPGHFPEGAATIAAAPSTCWRRAPTSTGSRRGSR